MLSRGHGTLSFAIRTFLLSDVAKFRLSSFEPNARRRQAVGKTVFVLLCPPVIICFSQKCLRCQK